MVQFLSIIFFLGFLQFLLGFSKVPVFFCVALYYGFIYLKIRASGEPFNGDNKFIYPL